MIPKICLYLAITNIWIIYRVIFKKDYSNDITQCKNPIILILRYLLTIIIGMPAFYLLILFSFITGLGFGRSIYISKRTKQIKQLSDDYIAELIILLIEAKIIFFLLFINQYIIKTLSAIRKKLIV